MLYTDVEQITEDRQLIPFILLAPLSLFSQSCNGNITRAYIIDIFSFFLKNAV